ncbi:hypothetical protein TrLO_g2154 [Triparma laevis f. longispina]|uniref:acetylornithine transaminase n=1 Tax=Triparma laevis f. longispina TaxID=1714387 RepID=A0A9W7FRS4_9STRA|nr:hypothetical protein TrLO_g2154 [Triparma laevis f. longispina]
MRFASILLLLPLSHSLSTPTPLKHPSTGPISISTFNQNVQVTYGRYPLTITRGEGTYLFDADENRYLDFVSGIATCALGHGNEKMREAVNNQMQKCHHISNLYYIPPQGHLASWLVENSCGDKVFFCNSGAEANEAAIKCARKLGGDKGIDMGVILSAKQSFHGRTLGSLSATGQPKYHEGFTYGGSMVQGFENFEFNSEEDLERVFRKFNKTPLWDKIRGRKRRVVGIMVEALQGEGGIKPGSPNFFKKARQLCDESEAILICDEVQVGMGRSGRLWGYENLGVEPDVFTTAKALGGGVPIGAMVASGEAATALGPGQHATTYGGNPLACAAGLAVATEICEKDLLTNVQKRGEQLQDGLKTLKLKNPDMISDIRGWGLLIGVELTEACGVMAGEVVGKAMEKGLLLVPAGLRVVRFVPPLNVSEEEVSDALKMFGEALEEAKNI